MIFNWDNEKGSKEYLYIQVPAVTEIMAYERLRKFINDNIVNTDYDKDIRVVNVRYIYTSKKLSKEYDRNYHIQNESYIELHERRRVVRTENVIGLKKIVHKSLGEVYFANDKDESRIGQVVEFLVPDRNKFRKTKMVYSRKFFKIEKV